jgi:hypothetical protein
VKAAVNKKSGAILYEDCTTRSGRGLCQCGRCEICGERKHTSVHGPVNGQGRGSKPFGHEFVPKAV